MIISSKLALPTVLTRVDSDGQTLLVKAYDHLPPKDLDLIVTDIGEAAPIYCYKLFERHYE